jgi:hypothetical protein
MEKENHIIKEIIKISPTFEAVYQDYLKEYGGESPGETVAMGELARHVINLANKKDFKTLESVLKKIEALYQKKDLVEILTVGFLEALQNNSGWDGMSQNYFTQYLGPISKKEWEELNKFWDKVEEDNGVSHH